MNKKVYGLKLMALVCVLVYGVPGSADDHVEKLTVIKNADWVLGWNMQEQAHVYLQDTDVVFVSNVMSYVGKDYKGDIEQEIDGSGLLVVPASVGSDQGSGIALANLARVAHSEDVNLIVAEIEQAEPVQQGENTALTAASYSLRNLYIGGELITEDQAVLDLAQATLDALLQTDSDTTFAFPLRQSNHPGVQQVVNGRSVLSGPTADVPLQRVPMPVPGLTERPLVPYGMSGTIDVAVGQMVPGSYELPFEEMVFDTIWFMRDGTATFKISDGNEFELNPGEFVLAPARTSYTVAITNGEDPIVIQAIHPFDGIQYKQTPLTVEQKKALNKDTKLFESLHGSLTDQTAEFEALEGNPGLTRRRVVESHNYEMNIGRMDAGAVQPEPQAQESDLYIQGISGSGAVIVNDEVQEVPADGYAFLPAGVPYQLSNSSDTAWEFIFITAH